MRHARGECDRAFDQAHLGRPPIARLETSAQKANDTIDHGPAEERVESTGDVRPGRLD
jgi:hypothetical protein